MKPSAFKHVNTPAPSAIAGKISLQRGLSLVELMISITIGLLILAALSSLLVNQIKTRTELDKSNRMIDNGRYALEVLTDNLSLAGYYGEFEPSSGVPPIPAALPDPCTLNTDAMEDALQLAVQGYNAAAQTSQISSLPCGFTYAGGSDSSLKAGSDILVIRRASTAKPIVAGAALAGTHYLQASRYHLDAERFKVSTDPTALTLRKLNPDSTIATADLRNFMVQVYFVSPHNAVGDGIPTLKRREIDQSNPSTNQFVVTPLVEGIEYMQVDYGLDSDNDGAPNSYVPAPALEDWPNVVTVKINILARNAEESRGYTDTKTYTLGSAGTFGPFNNDHYKRHAYTKFIRLINPAGRRE